MGQTGQGTSYIYYQCQGSPSDICRSPTGQVGQTGKGVQGYLWESHWTSVELRAISILVTIREVHGSPIGLEGKRGLQPGLSILLTKGVPRMSMGVL